MGPCNGGSRCVGLLEWVVDSYEAMAYGMHGIIAINHTYFMYQHSNPPHACCIVI